MSYLTEKWSRAIRCFDKSKIIALGIWTAFDTIWEEAVVCELNAKFPST